MMPTTYEWDEFQVAQGLWSDATFGIRTPMGPTKHLQKEVQEVIDEYEELQPGEAMSIKEFSDCQLLLMDAVRISGFTMSDLMNGCQAKFEINKARDWGEPDEHGTVEHIRKPGITAVYCFAEGDLLVVPDGGIFREGGVKICEGPNDDVLTILQAECPIGNFGLEQYPMIEIVNAVKANQEDAMDALREWTDEMEVKYEHIDDVEWF